MFKAAVFCGSKFDARAWNPGKYVTGLAMFGEVKIDFRQAQLEPGVTHVTCVNIFGVTQLRVPEGIPVNMNGVSLFGSTRDDGTEREAENRDHILEINYFNVFGATNIIK